VKIREATPQDHDALARVWLESWYSTGLKPLFDPGLELLRRRLPKEIAKGWKLFAADDGGETVAMLAIRPRDFYLDQLWVAPRSSGPRHRPRAASIHARAVSRRNLAPLRGRK
jgi:hypothetical protein